jgi:hypothetical protein
MFEWARASRVVLSKQCLVLPWYSTKTFCKHVSRQPVNLAPRRKGPAGYYFVTVRASRQSLLPVKLVCYVIFFDLSDVLKEFDETCYYNIRQGFIVPNLDSPLILG